MRAAEGGNTPTSSEATPGTFHTPTGPTRDPTGTGPTRDPVPRMYAHPHLLPRRPPRPELGSVAGAAGHGQVRQAAPAGSSRTPPGAQGPVSVSIQVRVVPGPASSAPAAPAAAVAQASRQFNPSAYLGLPTSHTYVCVGSLVTSALTSQSLNPSASRHLADRSRGGGRASGGRVGVGGGGGGAYPFTHPATCLDPHSAPSSGPWPRDPGAAVSAGPGSGSSSTSQQASMSTHDPVPTHAHAHAHGGGWHGSQEGAPPTAAHAAALPEAQPASSAFPERRPRLHSREGLRVGGAGDGNRSAVLAWALRARPGTYAGGVGVRSWGGAGQARYMCGSAGCGCGHVCGGGAARYVR